MADRVAWALALAVLGAIVGSFVAVLTIRWPAGRSVMAGRSACDACGRTLRAWELVPLASAAALGGRCTTCRAAIPPLHWRVEALALAIGAAAGAVAPGLEGVIGAACGWVLLALGTLDLLAFWLPDRLTAALATVALGGAAADVPPPVGDRLIGGGIGFGLLWAVARLYRRVRGRTGMGGGDPKLFGAIGLWLGWQLLPAVLLVASATGLGVVLWRRWRGWAMTADAALPLGTLLAIAAYPAWLLMVGMRS